MYISLIFVFLGIKLQEKVIDDIHVPMFLEVMEQLQLKTNPYSDVQNICGPAHLTIDHIQLPHTEVPHPHYHYRLTEDSAEDFSMEVSAESAL